ncbi:MAG TPA: LCP family protein, partial [Candidatus Saccharimonadales bacterium]|nr:LCP family protein [Candidatus Saccharimonadales bacterium]
EAPDLTDTMLIASIDPVNKSADLVSIPRDLWVTVPSYGSMKINSVYANAKYRSLNSAPKDTAKADTAGITATEQVITDVLGIPIHYYGVVDFHAFQQAVDTVGGVDFNVPSSASVTDYMYNEATHRPYTLNVPAGDQHFDGLRALMYVRTRHTSLRGDFDRTERQRLFIQALSNKILSAGTYTNPLKISQLMSDFGDHVSTDFSITDAVRLMQIGKNIPSKGIVSIGLADPPNNFVTTDSVGSASVVRPSAGFGDYSQIQSYIRNTLQDPYLSQEKATVAVLNGTNVSGLATAQSEKLKSFGYNVVSVADAPTHTYAKTVIVDLTSGKKPYTKNYLQKRYGVNAVTKLPDTTIQATGNDFVIILGQDAAASSQN